MEFRIWVDTRLAGCILERELVAEVERPAVEIGPEEIGRSLDEDKTVLTLHTNRDHKECRGLSGEKGPFDGSPESGRNHP